MKKIREWWSNRHWRKVRDNILKLTSAQQLGIAQSIIASTAVPFPRHRREQFLKIQSAKIKDMTKELVEENKMSR